MSAYRNKPPPPRWRVIYSTPLLQRVGRGAVLGAFGALALIALLAIGSIAFLGDSVGALAAIGTGTLMVLVTAGALAALHWTSFAMAAEYSIRGLESDPDDEARCRIEGDNQRWILPVRRALLRDGQIIQVRYRDFGADSTAVSRREILEIKVIDE